MFSFSSNDSFQLVFQTKGRIKLSDTQDKKGISYVDKNDGRELTFQLQDDEIQVIHVPGVYGVRIGSIVKGFVQSKSEKIQEVKYPPKSKRKLKDSCALSELMTFNGIKQATDTLVFDTPCTYCTRTMNVDTKDFGLPQTRQRGYLFVWQPEDGNVLDNLVSRAHYYSLHLMKIIFLFIFIFSSIFSLVRDCTGKPLLIIYNHQCAIRLRHFF